MEMRVQVPCLPLGVPNDKHAPMVKRMSCHASNVASQVQLLVGVLIYVKRLDSARDRIGPSEGPATTLRMVPGFKSWSRH